MLLCLKFRGARSSLYDPSPFVVNRYYYYTLSDASSCLLNMVSVCLGLHECRVHYRLRCDDVNLRCEGLVLKVYFPPARHGVPEVDRV